METELRAVSAHTKNRNTPESDRDAYVMHVVNISDGSTLEVMASDPLSAIDQVNRVLAKHLAAKPEDQNIEPGK